MPDKRRTLVFFKTLIVSVASSFLFIVLSITLAPIIVEFGLDVIDVIVNLGKWNHAELAKVLHISHQRVSTLKKKDFKVTGHGNCGKMEAEAYSVPGAHILRFLQEGYRSNPP